VPVSNAPLVPLVLIPVPNNVRRLDGGGTPRSAYIYSGGGAVVDVAVVQREKGTIILGMLMVVVVGSGAYG